MIYAKVGINDLCYEIENVLKLFYSSNEIMFIDNPPPTEHRGVFVLVEPFGEGWGSDVKITLRTEKGLEFVRTVYKDSICRGKNDREKQRCLKNEIKRQIYMLLSNLTGKNLPWGMLTGIRPGKIVHELIEQGLEKEEILCRLQDYYKVSSSKSHLLYQIAEVERDIIKKTHRDLISIYIGIPFCPTRCLYCSFTSNPIAKYPHLVDSYLQALKQEISGVERIIKQNGYKIQSIYIGGGTPTSIDAVSLDKLLEFIDMSFDIKDINEYTLEAGRPDSIDIQKLKVARENRVSRISINPQTMNDRTLQLIGRNHTARDIIDKFNLAREMGFSNINMDIIIGLPGENLDMFKNTLKQIEKLEPESLTVHTMAIKRASRLNESRNEYDLVSPQEASDMIDAAHKHAKAMGMHPYYLYRQKNMLGNLENIGYCKPGFEGVYNIQIMEERQTIIALGAGAITKVVYPEENRIERAFNVKNIEEYISRVDEMVERKKALFE